MGQPYRGPVMFVSREEARVLRALLPVVHAEQEIDQTLQGLREKIRATLGAPPVWQTPLK